MTATTAFSAPRTVSFTETMQGTWCRLDHRDAGSIRFDLIAQIPTPIRPLGTVQGTLTGTVSIDGLVSHGLATGTIEIAPLSHGRIRYQIDVAEADDGRSRDRGDGRGREGDGGRGDRDGDPDGDAGRYRLDGWKTIRWTKPFTTWTTLPVTIFDSEDRVVGTATLRFALGDLPAFLGSAIPRKPRPAAITSLKRFAGETKRRQGATGALLAARRWRGERGRIDVWYDTITDPVTGTGLWLHHELLAPTSGMAPAAHGWVALFLPERAPLWARFGPAPVERGEWFAAGDVLCKPGVRRGRAGSVDWELRCEESAEPLWVFPSLAWRHQLLPGAQVVASPTARFTGQICAGAHVLHLRDAPGASARIYGHGNAERWAWLHADLGCGDILEVVAATARRPPLDHLRVMPLIQLRLGGIDWPSYPMVAARGFHCDIGLPQWTISGRWGHRRLHVTVTQPADRCVTIGYVDPDGTSATCTNTERADAQIVLEHRRGATWHVERSWKLHASAHAEIGTRP